MGNTSRQRGFSLIELILVMALLGALGSVGAYAFAPFLDSWSIAGYRTETVNTVENALTRMVSEVAQLRDAQSVVAAAANNIRFVDTANEDITYALAGGNLTRNGVVLARGIQSLGFTYWDMYNAALAIPVVAPGDTNIWRIEVTLVGQSGGQTIRMSSQIHPRNLRRP